MSNPIETDQPSIVLNQVVVESGIFPARGSALDDPNGIPMGTIRTFATVAAQNSNYPLSEPAQGGLLPINQAPALFSVFGITYAGNGTINFALPNLSGTVAVGAGNSVGSPLMISS